MSVKLQSDFKEQGLELPDIVGDGSGIRFKPDKEGIITLPDGAENYAKMVAHNAPFRVAGKSFAGFGEGSMPKPWRQNDCSTP